ncbi:MAG: hypothetical protein HRT44_10270 [Bdellovibrionales bacterium]|nr:EF-hand domain-containing protein [Bdellovibrionales bacterium]NQZ19624.1 hypothetical protein [Bdellovibrionales bacterium]
MKNLIVIASLLLLGACAHHGHKHGGKMGCKSHKKMMWENMDANKDGKVSKEEWMKDKQQWFADMDTNKDGFVTMEEKKAHHKMKHAKMMGDKKDGKSCCK